MLCQGPIPTNLPLCKLQSPFGDSRRGKDAILAGNCSNIGTNRATFVARKSSNGASSYGGCIPSILQALDTIPNLDDALKPWEGSLGNKARTIILKEQVEWGRALEIFEWFKKEGCYELNVIHYNIMLRMLGKARKWGMIESLWLEMQEKGIEPKNSTYGTLIDVFSKGGLKKKALVWLGDMIKKGLEPDEITLGTVVQTYKEEMEFEEAQQFFRKWSLFTGGDLSCPRCHNSHTFNMLIDMFGKAGQVKEAYEAFDEMVALGVTPTVVTFNAMIHMCGNHGRWLEVASLMVKMEELGCLPDTRTYNILISLYAKSDNIEMASWYFSKMKKAGLVPNVISYRTLLYAYAIRGMVSEAECLVLDSEERGYEIDEYTQSALARMYIDAGMMEKSWSWFEKFQHTMTSDCYAANIDAFAVHGHFFYAEKAFSQCLRRQKLSVSVFNVMIKAYGIMKNYEKVCDTIDGMNKYAISPDKCTFNSVIQILSRAELPMKAVRYVRKMQSAGLIDDCVPYCAVISSFVRLCEFAIAEDLFQEMVKFGIKPDVVVFGILINAYAELGNIAEAEKYVDLMKHAGYPVNSVVCCTLIKLYTKAQYLQKAVETYKNAQLLVDGPDLYSSNCMIELYVENNMVGAAENVFSLLKQRDEANEFSYAMMMCLYKKVGQYKEGFSIAQEMIKKGLLRDVLSYTVAIELFALNGRLTVAFKLLKQMLNSGLEPNDATFKSLGISLIQRGVSKDAIKHLELTRKKDSKNGLRVWLETLHSMLNFDDPVLNIGRKLERIPQA